jgi:hypothetical protein
MSTDVRDRMIGSTKGNLVKGWIARKSSARGQAFSSAATAVTGVLLTFSPKASSPVRLGVWLWTVMVGSGVGAVPAEADEATAAEALATAAVTFTAAGAGFFSRNLARFSNGRPKAGL